jgi:hypothetical protein
VSQKLVSDTEPAILSISAAEMPGSLYVVFDQPVTHLEPYPLTSLVISWHGTYYTCDDLEEQFDPARSLFLTPAGASPELDHLTVNDPTGFHTLDHPELPLLPGTWTIPFPTPQAPVPIAAHWAGTPGASDLVVTFDQLLTLIAITPTNWTFVYDDSLWAPDSVGVNAATVILSEASIIDDASGPTRVNYNAQPPDVTAWATGLLAAAFLDFPVT